MSDVSFSVTGLEAVHAALINLSPKVRAAVAWAAVGEANAILEASQPHVPVLSGDLKTSGRVETEGTPGNFTGIEVTISYGNHGEVPYAGLVHEDTTMNHPRGGQAHYLSEPYYAATAGMAERLAAAIQAALGR